jgi:predicted aconitase with swiveling domain
MKRSGRVFEGRALVGGIARGVALVLDEPLSFWGGVDPASGVIIDTRHPQAGASITGKVLAMPSGRGSSSSSSVMVEAMRAGTCSAATVLRRADDIVALGALVGRELYGVEHPVVTLAGESWREIQSGDEVEVRAHGEVATVTITESSRSDSV